MSVLHWTVHHRPGRRLLAAPVLAAVAALTACGGGGTGGSQADGPVATRDIDGVGTVLVDRSGKTLYFAEQETKDQILCTGRCTQFWQPLTTSGKAAPDAGDLPKSLATVKRPGDTTQFVYGGHPLYTFSEDGGPGSVKGNGFTDSFAGTSFTWHAVTPQGTAASTQPSSTGGSGGGYGGY